MTNPSTSNSGGANADRVDFSIESGVASLTLTRSDKYNALDPPMLTELLAAIRTVRQRDDVRVLVLGGEGSTFCAGVDLRTPFFMENVVDDSVFEGMRLLDWQHEMIAGIYELPFLTIAAVHGNVVGGGGFGMAMACDLRFAVRDARFWMVPGVLDVVQDFGLTWLLQRVIGPARTMEFVFSGEPIDVMRGEQMGLVNRVFDTREALESGITEFVGPIRSRGTDAVRLLKFVVRHGMDSGLSDQLKLEAISNGLCFQSNEFRSKKADYLENLKMGAE